MQFQTYVYTIAPAYMGHYQNDYASRLQLIVGRKGST